jgi:FMN reductase
MLPNGTLPHGNEHRKLLKKERMTTGLSSQLHIVGIGGTLRANSTSRWALEHALRAAEAAGASTELLDLNQLRLPMYEPDLPLDAYGPHVQQFIDVVRRADALIWSTAGYHGSLAAPTKNALDLLEFLNHGGEHTYLNERVVGLIATAGGDLAAVNSINAMVHIAHALRATVAPLFVPIGQSWKQFDDEGRVLDPKTVKRLDQLGRLVVDTAARFHGDAALAMA